MKTIQEAIVAIAQSYIGQKEKPNNSGFVDKTFEEQMRQAGWQHGWAWCSIFCKLVWLNAYKSMEDITPGIGRIALVKKLFSPSTLTTFRQFKEAGKSVSDKPQVGDVVIWQHGKGATGHAGIVIEVGPGNEFSTVEGNTNEAGGREGDRVAIKKRKTGIPYTATGLNLVGFIRPV